MTTPISCAESVKVTPERLAAIIDPYIDDDGSHVSHLRHQIALGKADAIILLFAAYQPEQPA